MGNSKVANNEISSVPNRSIPWGSGKFGMEWNGVWRKMEIFRLVGK